MGSLIFARCLAKIGGTGGGIEVVVPNLKGKPQVLGEPGDLLPSVFIATPWPRPGSDLSGRPNKRAGLQAMHVFERGLIERLPYHMNVDRLTTRHAISPGGLGKAAHHLQHYLRCSPISRRNPGKGEALQGISHEECRGLIVGHMHRRLPATQIVIVHTRKIIMDKRKGMDKLERAGQSQCERTLGVASCGLTRRHHKKPAGTLSPV